MAALNSAPATTPVPPRERGGWWHAYVCPVHGVELEHGDLLGGTFPDGGAACAYGCRIDTPDVRGAWTVLAHQACALRLRHLAASDQAADRAAAAAGLRRYAGLYAELTASGEHAGAQGWMLRGRMFQQALTEAIWAVNIGHAARSLAGHGETDGVRPLLRALAEAAQAARTELLAQGKERSNYTAWLNAAIAVCDDTAPTGLRGHPHSAIHPDGWEWEGSTYYHLFVLRAYLLSLRGTDPAGLPAADAEQLAAMIAALAGVATPAGELPALHDGPYRRTGALAELREVCLLAHQLFAGEPLRAVLAWTAERTPEPPADLAGWFTGGPRPYPYRQPRRLFPDTGYAVVRAAGVHAVLDAGPHGGSHGHQDKLALYLYGEGGEAWQPDPGQVPYAHRHFRAHYASAAAHPAFSVDGQDQAPADARLTGAGTAECDGAYEDVRARRSVTATSSYLLDVLTLDAARERTLTAHLRPAVVFEATAHADATVRTRWGGVGDGTLSGCHLAAQPAEFTLVAQPGPADDPSRTVQGADWSVHGRRAVFVSVYHRGPSPVSTLRLDDDVLAIQLSDGSIHHHTIGE